MKKILLEELTMEELIFLLRSAWQSGSALGDPEFIPEAKEAQENWFIKLGLIEE